MDELRIPDEIEKLDDATEFVRFWIAGGYDYVSLNVGAMGEDDVFQWGMILADISVHIIRALRQDGATASEEELRAQIENGYSTRLKTNGVEYTGVIGGTRQ
jgi:hypothetical protein